MKIGDAAEVSMKSQGFYLMESDKTIVPPLREYDEEDFPEYDGTYLDNRTTFKAFDYTIKFLCLGTEEQVTSKVYDFYYSLFTTSADSDIKVAKLLKIKNMYYLVQLDGYAKIINPKDYLTHCNNEKDAYIFELGIRVNNPQSLNPI